MLRAGALFVAVTISFVIAVLISLLITIAFQYKIQNRENLLQKKLIRNANSAIVMLMADTEDTLSVETKLIDLYGEQSDSVQIKKYSWGVYEVATVKAFSGRYSVIKTAEYGYKPDALSGAIYLTDLSKPLSLFGRTKITGTCYLPETGVRYIEGAAQINGFILKSENSLPSLNKGIIEKLADSFGTNPFQIGLYKEGSIEGKDTLINSFLDTTLLIRVSGNIELSGKYLFGNIILYTDHSLIIEESTKLEDVLIFARDIKIKNGFTGNLQAFATDSILVEENCKLNYPSALGLFKKDHKTQQPFIKLLKNSEMRGIIFTTQSEFVSDQSQTLVSIEKEALLQGQLYVDGLADIKGEVRGMVWCNKFLLRTPSSSNENQLRDAVIDKTKLSKYYVGSGLIASGKKKKIIKWLE